MGLEIARIVSSESSTGVLDFLTSEFVQPYTKNGGGGGYIIAPRLGESIQPYWSLSGCSGPVGPPECPMERRSKSGCQTQGEMGALKWEFSSQNDDTCRQT